MKYQDGYKYQLNVREVFTGTNITPPEAVVTKYISLYPSGLLVVRPGYAWDGPSGPTYDSKNSIRASLAHDALYQLMRMKLVDVGWRTDADILLDSILKQDGMWAARRWYWLKGVQWFAGGAADPSSRKKVLSAP